MPVRTAMTTPFRRGLSLLILISRFLVDLVVSSAVVAWEVLTPRHHMRPAVVTVAIRCRSDIQITILANMISLTPGTLTIDVDEDAGTIDVHGLHIRSADELRARIARIEDRLLEVVR